MFTSIGSKSRSVTRSSRGVGTRPCCQHLVTIARCVSVSRMASQKSKAFPKGFTWGTATAAHQVEGNNWNNDWWDWEHTPGSPCVEPSGESNRTRGRRVLAGLDRSLQEDGAMLSRQRHHSDRHAASLHHSAVGRSDGWVGERHDV
ncbi:MAG: glycosyl hydrolase family protein [Actinobacteria bacterium]|nr:glycosyl hydrolase family protein [Actinomycetota bacterium]